MELYKSYVLTLFSFCFYNLLLIMRSLDANELSLLLFFIRNMENQLSQLGSHN